jgi:hypothetical protein
MNDLNEELNLEWFLESYNKNKNVRTYKNLVRAIHADFIQQTFTKETREVRERVAKALGEMTELDQPYFSDEWIIENILKDGRDN